MALSEALAALFAGGARPPCYVASALGFSDSTRPYYNDVYLPALAAVVEPIDPWSLTSAAEIAAAHTPEEQHRLGLVIGARNIGALTQARMVVAHLDGQEVDSGTAAEVGYAAARGLPCVAIRTDWRRAGEPGMHVNLQVESFVVTSGGFVARSLEEVVERLGAASH